MSRKIQVLVSLTVPDDWHGDGTQFVSEGLTQYADEIPPVTAEGGRVLEYVEVGEVLNLPNTAGHVARMDVEHTGGNVYVDVLTLADGSVLAVAPDDIILYPSREAMDDDSEDPYAFPRIGRHGYA